MIEISRLMATVTTGEDQGGLAQLVERYNGIVEVMGSTPLSSTLWPDSKSNKPRESPEAFFVDASEAVQRKAKYPSTPPRFVPSIGLGNSPIRSSQGDGDV